MENAHGTLCTLLCRASGVGEQEFSACCRNTPLANIPAHPRTRTLYGAGDNIGPEISIVFSSETILAFPEVIMWKSRFCRIAFPRVSFRDRWTPCQAGRMYRNPRGDNNTAGGWVGGPGGAIEYPGWWRSIDKSAHYSKPPRFHYEFKWWGGGLSGRNKKVECQRNPMYLRWLHRRACHRRLR